MANKAEEIPVKLTVDTSSLSELESAANDIPSDIDISVNATGDFSDLGFDEIPDETNTQVNTTETPEGKEVRDGITFLAGVKAIEIAMNIAGNVFEFVKNVGEMTVGGFLDIEDAVARINAQTGTAIPDLDQMIRDFQAADLGDSVDQIASVVIHAQQLGAPIEEATTAALSFTKVFDTESPETVLTTLNTLVETGLVPNLQEASDLMTVFFQTGGNVGGDALAVVNANAQSWADMGLSATEALSAVNSLQTGTGATATDAAKILQTFDDALTAAAADPTSAQANTLKLMGIDNPKDQGMAIGAETIDGFASAFANLPVDQQDLVSGLFFGKGGKKFTGAIEGLTTQGGPFAEYIGAAEEAGKTIDDSLRGAIDDFILEINTSIATLLSSENIDLPGKIAALKEGFQAAAETLASGGSLGDALSVGFHIEGVDGALTNIERVFGNLVISMLELIAFIQDPTGLGDADKGTRGEIARLATQQLPFDIKIANPEELDTVFAQAAQRGVTDLGGALTTALDELVAEGNFEQVEGILNQLLISPDVDPAAAQTLVDKYTAAIDAAVAAQKPPAETDGWWNRLKPPSDLGDSKMFTDPTGAGAKGMDWWTNMTPPPETTTAIQTFETDVDTAMTNAALASTLASDEMLLALAAMSDGVVTADEEIALGLTGNTVTASFDAVLLSAQSTFPAAGQFAIGLATDIAQLDVMGTASINHLTAALAALKGLAGQVSAAVAAALNDAGNLGKVGTGDGGEGPTIMTTVNQTNNNQNGAQTDATTYQIAAAVNGFT